MAGEGEWKNGLCGCFGDCGLCILTYFLPCVTAGQNAEKVGKSCCLYGFLSLLGCIGIYTRAVVRTEIRETKSIQVDTAGPTYSIGIISSLHLYVTRFARTVKCHVHAVRQSGRKLDSMR